MVVLYHSGLFLSGGFVGVDVFFVISGFVITASLQREWITSGTVRLRRGLAVELRCARPGEVEYIYQCHSVSADRAESRKGLPA